MEVLSKDKKILTLFLILRTMPKEQQSLLMKHFNPDVIRRLNEIEQVTSNDIEKLDWTPFYQSWPELQKILGDCKEEMRIQKLLKCAEEQRPKVREYILSKTGRQKKGPPIFLSPKVVQVIDQYLTSL